MTDHLTGRAQVLRSLREELIGPSPAGGPLETSQPVSFSDAPASYGPWTDASTGEEIIQRDSPTKRYGVGVLYPIRTEATEDDTSASEAETASRDELPGDDDPRAVPAVQELLDTGPGALDSDDFDLSSANDYRPSTMAVTCLLAAEPSLELSVEVTGGRYSDFHVQIATGAERAWWVRSPVKLQATFAQAALLSPERPHVARPPDCPAFNTDGLDLEISAFSRPRPGGEALVTFSLTNRHRAAGFAYDAHCLFQTHFAVKAVRPDGAGAILPYPRDIPETEEDREEEQSFELLYRNAKTYAVGHGCAANWEDGGNGSTVTWVSAEALPHYETPSITPQVLDADGRTLNVPMGPLAGLDPSDDGLALAERVIDLYESWIRERRNDVTDLDARYAPAADRHVAECETAGTRMRAGLELLRSDNEVAAAFRLANHAVLLQQLRTRTTPREVIVDPTGRYKIADAVSTPDWRSAEGRGRWRPFQLAFLLASLPSVAHGDHPDRELVELIWFPTGGGKTEAYLGLSAFAMFLRRLRDPSDAGTEVLMRYTLRLLTTQQFLRAAALVCAMEHLRARDPEALGTSRFSIGVWLGAGATPNTRDAARRSLRALNRGDRFAENAFLLLRCPWCSAQMGPIKAAPKAPRSVPRVAGYVEDASTVRFRCPDGTCEFSQLGLPIYVVDEDIYEHRPSIVIGTVDKFAVLTWRPAARSIFGIEADGSRVVSPPGTIIQDELHLISGPLGSVVGLYEGVIEELCTDHRIVPPTKPKIVSSTATIRRFEQQIAALYGRPRVALFPPRGLDADDSFFARYDRDESGNLQPGRLYVGVHGPGLGSVQTAQVRTFSALLQAPVQMDDEHRDPWWTLLAFFNSLRELGTSLSLSQSDIPDYLRVLRNRYGLGNKDVRMIKIPKELTGRLRQDDIPKAIDELSRKADSTEAVDMCLASNIIEVGVDIDRLSLICVVGQPKTTSQYIQVTGRVGRLWRERPGLVVTILSPSKPRDRSHFERFRSYHERLYAQVEPTSVTPFAPPVLERALHAVLCAFVRQTGPDDLRPWPVPERLIGQGADLLRERARQIDPAELGALKELIDARIQEWKSWERIDWSGSTWTADGRAPLLRGAGEWAPADIERVTWSTPTSMRNVDAECMLRVTNSYAAELGGAL